ncbi:isopentenyl-diphosphate delta-isomerase type 1 [Ectocarpus siliculosus]|uniref:isopentenyl-diphosphate Delta-isomerase n=1 Tax=Ectocarpus siliculosus TaxID=2880 RepID=D8LM69_ECTSI|nr:isopentenyl-diphosphate delta-isomerase type 1 [Ectocarpus siliculosus]|eukprot:CBN79702.1 isopentenyl-diphosphate delta-isomerase type 1 [Ectocarpus siliculosus]
MMAEECILVDRNDRPTGSASKVETHLTSKGLLLHRAFSVFLFDKKGRVLMQRRADSKHTFAGYWTNTCCSHPLWNDVEMGTDMTTPRGEKSASEGDAAIAGATRAAVRKLGQELGIPAAQLPLEDFSFLTKVHYIANSGSTWGEHEIDYVYLIQADVDLEPNPNEVSDAEFLDKDGLRSLLARAERGEVEFTPWSAYIIDKFVFGWWDHVGDKEKLASLRDSVIHRVGSCADEEEE